jgi:uncharacterized membrane protein
VLVNPIVPVIAILCSGLMAGLLLGDWLGPAVARARMSVSSFVQFQQIIHSAYLRVLPALSSIALAAPILWSILWRDQWGTAAYGALLGATFAVAAGFAITILVNIPVNHQLEQWDAANPPADARAIWRPWEIAHVARTILWTTGFLLEIVSIVMFR